MKLFANPIGFRTLFIRESMRYMKVYVQTLISPIISNILFLGVFGGMFAARAVGVDGTSYLSFMVPGLCIMGSINAGFQNPSSSLIIQKYQGLHQELNAFPITSLEKTLGFVLAGTIRGVLVGALTYIATIPFVGAQIAHPIGFFTMLTAIAFLFSSIGLVIGLSAKTFDTVNFVQIIVITPLTYLGGVFFEVTKLPFWIASYAMYNPFFPIVDATRLAYLGVSEVGLPVSLIFVVGASLMSFCIAYGCVARGVGLKS